jgi:glycosyltransferase involved in cell wall biosynthesis
MNICIFTENHFKGGIDTFIVNLINAWPDKDDQITIICNAGHPGISTIEQKIIREYDIQKYSRLFTSNLANGSGSSTVSQWPLLRLAFSISYRLFQHIFLFPWYVVSLTVRFCLSDFDRLIVINGGYPASLLCRSAIISWRFAGKSKLGVFNFHNSVPTSEKKLGCIESLVDDLVKKSSAHVVTVSRNCLESLAKRPKLNSHPKRSYILNGIGDPLENILPSKIGEKNVEPIKPYLLMLSTYEPRKGHLFLLKAFQIVHQMYPNLLLQTYGFGDNANKAEISNEAERLGLTSFISLNDFTSETDELIQNASVVVVPSQEYESFNLTIIEAMAFGIPVVTTDVGGMPEVLEGSGAGYVCSRNDPNDFAMAINKILGNQELATTMGRCGRATYEKKYTAEKMALEYWKLLK